MMVGLALALAACEKPSSIDGGETIATSAIEEVEREVGKILGVGDNGKNGAAGEDDNDPANGSSIPVARPVPDKPGFVVSPYNGRWIDVTGIEPGSLVADPYVKSEEKKVFRVPPAAGGESGDPSSGEDTETPAPVPEPVV